MTPCACSSPDLSAITMSAPSRANATAMPAPMPDAPPLTTASRPSGLLAWLPRLLLLSGRAADCGVAFCCYQGGWAGGAPDIGDLRAARQVEPVPHQQHRRVVLLLV